MLRRLVSAARLNILRLRSRWGNVSKHAGLRSGLRLHHLHKKQRSNMARTKEFTFKQDFTRTLVKHHPWLKASHPRPPSGIATSRDFDHEPCRSSPQRRPTAKPRISTGGAEMEPALNRADKGKLALGSGHNHHRPASGLTRNTRELLRRGHRKNRFGHRKKHVEGQSVTATLTTDTPWLAHSHQNSDLWNT